MVLKMAEEALHGNVKAFTAVRDSAGDKPVDTSEIKAEVVTDTDMELVRNVAERLSGRKEDWQVGMVLSSCEKGEMFHEMFHESRKTQ